MTSNTSDRRPDAARPARQVLEPPAGGAEPVPPAEGAADTLKPTDARAMRALAHPVRLALLGTAGATIGLGFLKLIACARRSSKASI